MKVKNDRLETIRQIIATKRISSQDVLLEALQKRGFRLTQATLSRDLKHLKVAKASTQGDGYVYVMPTETTYKRVPKRTAAPREEATAGSGFVSINFSGNMAVVKTRPGYASAVAWDIDSHDVAPVLGTIAGDDTIFIVIKEGFSHEQVTEALQKAVPSMK